MAYQTKTIEYAEHQVKIAEFAKALSHPARIAIIELLHRKGDCFCGNLVDELPISQSTVSQHLRELKEVGLINAVDMPPKVKYCLDKEHWLLAKKYFSHLFDNN